MPFLALAALLPTLVPAQQTPGNVPGPRFEISFPSSRSAKPLDGRLLVLVSNDSTDEPRFQVADGLGTQLAFGIDMDAFAPGDVVIVDSHVVGYPLERINYIPSGRYRVQALLNRYETFHRADGHTVKLPPDMGEGQQWNRKPGNLYSAPEWITIRQGPPLVFRISLDSTARFGSPGPFNGFDCCAAGTSDAPMQSRGDDVPSSDVSRGTPVVNS